MTKGLEQLRDYHAETAIILGSGLNSRVVDPAKDQIIPYAEFSEIPQPSVPGQIGRFVLGEIEKTKIIFAQGRVHLYEGHSAREVTSIVRVLAEAHNSGGRARGSRSLAVAVLGRVTNGPPSSDAALVKATSGISLGRPSNGNSLRNGKNG